MTSYLSETIQRNLNLPPLQKIDPNIQETKEAVPRHSKQKLAQAAIPAVLMALHKFVRTDEGCTQVASGSDNIGWMHFIFDGKERVAVDKVAHYAGVTPEDARSCMEKITNEAIIRVRNEAKDIKKPDAVRTYMDSQRHDILVHLPAAMQIGDLLNDEALDDRTHKMEGPVSNFMHSIEKKLSKGDQSKYP